MYGYEERNPRDHYDAILDSLDSMYEQLEKQIDKKESQITILENRLDVMLEDAIVVSVRLAEQNIATDLAYAQRALAAIALAHCVLSAGGTAGVGQDDRVDQPDNWRTVLYVDTPAGQLSWHIAPADQAMLQGLPAYTGTWYGTYNSSNVEFYKGFTNA